MAGDFESVPITAVSLAGIELFEELPGETRGELARHCHGRRYAADSLICTHEDRNTDVFFIISGNVRITFYSASGKEISFRDQHSGEMFGELSAIDGRGRSAYVVALSESLIATMSQASFLRALGEHPAVALATLRRLASLVRLLSERVIEFSTLGVKNRIHAELLRLANEHEVEGNVAVIAPAPRHADIASRVSTHREAVTRELNELARAGLLKRAENRLTICDLASLERLVREVRGV